MIDILRDLGIYRVVGGGSGEVIKSVQRGKINSHSTSNDITINEIDPNKSIVLLHSYYAAGATPYMAIPRINIVDATTLRVERGVSTVITDISWEVIEFNNVKSVQRGEQYSGGSASEQIITINPVNINKSFLYHTFTHVATGAAISNLNPLSDSMFLYDESTIKIKLAMNFSKVAWQLIEFK
jgi:hypothetical protein